MVLAHLEQPALHEDTARQIRARPFGVPASSILRLAAWGLNAYLGQGSLSVLAEALAKGLAPIIFLRTGELPYWQEDTPHAVVLVGLDPDAETAFLLDPAYEYAAPVAVSLGDLILAWSHFDMVYAVISGKT